MDIYKIKKFLEEHSLFEFIKEFILYPELWPEFKQYGRFYVVNWLHYNIQEGWNTDVFDFFVEKQMLYILNFLKSSGRELKFTEKSLESACRNKNIELVKWLHENTFKFETKKAMILAVENNCTNIVHFLLENDYPYTNEVMELAALNHEHDLVRAILKKRTEPITRRTVDILLDYIEDLEL